MEGPLESSDGRQWVAVLRHPLVVGAALAVFSGVLASLLIPALTRVWQDRPRELALKRELVERISTRATEAIDRGNLFDPFAKTLTNLQDRNRFLHDVRHTWQVDTSVIGSQLNTYFHETSLPEQWDAFQTAVRHYFEYETKEAFPHEGDSPSAADLDLLLDYFRSVRFNNADDEETRQDFTSKRPAARLAHQLLPELLLAERDAVENRIVESNASGFSHGFWIFR